MYRRLEERCIEGWGCSVLKAERCISDHALIYGMVPGAVKKQQNVQIVRCWSRCDINAVMYVRPGGCPLVSHGVL